MGLNLQKPNTKTIGIRVTEEDYTFVKALADKHNLSVSNVAKAMFSHGLDFEQNNK